MAEIIPKALSKESKISYYKKVEFKEEGEEFFSEGFIATTHPDRAQQEGYNGDVLTKHAIESVVDQVNSRRALMADLASNRHDWVKEKNPELPVAGRAVEAELRELPDGHYGAWVKTHHNKTHPEFNDIKYQVEKGYLPGYSIEYEVVNKGEVNLPDGPYRLIDELDLCGFGLANGRLIANPQAVLTGYGYKEIMQSIGEGNPPADTKQSEVKTMAEEKPQEPAAEEPKVEVEEKKEEPVAPVEEKKEEIDAKELEEFRRFQNMKLKEKKAEEIKIAVKEALAQLIPEQKVRMNTNPEYKEVSSSIEFKEWKEINNDSVGVNQAFNRATALAKKSGAFDRWWYEDSRNRGKPVEFKTGGFYGEKIEIKALETDTNKSTDTDYLQSAAELSDIYAPAIAKMLNQKTTWFGMIPKVDFSGREAITWRAENVANSSAAAYAEGDAITKGNTTRQKLREVFKYYKVGVQVTGQMIESSKSGIGDVFQAEVEAATRALLSVMNVALFAETGAFTATTFLGLEYIADSTGNTTLYGLTRSTTNLLGASGSEYSAQSSAAISKATLRTAIRTLETNGANRGDLVFVCDPVQRDMILALLDDAQRFNGTSPRAGFEGMPQFDGVPIFTDKDANTDDIFLCNIGVNGLRLGVQVPVRFEDLAKSDDSKSGFLKFYGNQYAIAPKQALYMIQGLATS